MRWQIVDGYLADDQGRLVDEGQTVEFKESPNSRARQEAIQTCVAFANRDGGKILLGVSDNGLVKGTDMSGKSVENLVDEIRDHTFPSILPPVDEVDVSGKRIVVIDVAAYVPPVVGVYLYSDQPIAQHKPVDAGDVQAFVRVGRTNQKEDFMHLRQPQPSDPKVRIRVTLLGASFYSDDPSLTSLNCPVWTEDGSATAHAVRLCLNPAALVSEEMVEDLPRPGSEGLVGFERLYIHSVPLKQLLDVTEIASIYFDDWGIGWKVSRGIRVEVHEDEHHRWIDVEDSGLFARRIVTFPPKVGAQP